MRLTAVLPSGFSAHQNLLAPLILALWLGPFPWPASLVAADQPVSPATVKSFQLVLSPLRPRVGAGELNILNVVMDAPGLSNASIHLTSPVWAAPKTVLVTNSARGDRTLALEIPALSAPTAVAARLQTPAGSSDFGPFTLSPTRAWTIYMAQHTHTDIGYTRPQTEILPEHLRYIDYALDYCDLTDGYPDDARFRWTCETSWAVREYLQGRPAKQVERLKRRVAEGRIALCGLMLNMSEIATESSLAALVRPLRALKDEFGLEVRTAMQNDVNGAGWCLVDYFSDIGIRYLTMGINQTRSILPFDRPTPFWWESPSGKRVLAYRADHYHLGNMWHIQEADLDKFRPYVEKYLRSLEQRGYPFDRIGVQFSGYHTDNSPPAAGECDLVKAWNEKFASPKLRLATAPEFLAYLEQEHRAELPVHRQAWPDWWTDGFGSAARETAAARETETAMQVNYGLLTIASLLGAPISPKTMHRAAAVQDDLLFYHEHTYGAAESISDPLAENTQVQWAEKMSYAWTAVKNANLLREEAFGLVQEFLPRAEVPTLAVFNTLSWPRSGLVRVFIDHEMLPPDREFRLLDGTQAVLAQAMERRAEGTYWALWVREVPPLGFKILRLETSNQPRPKPAPGADTLALENGFYTIALDPEQGALQRLFDKETGQELVDPQSPWALGQCVYETMPAARDMKPDLFKRTTVRRVKVKAGATGPIWKSLVVSADLDGCDTNNGVRCEIRLYEPEKRVELRYAMRKLPVRTPEAVYVAFPFRAPDAKLFYEAQGGVVAPGADQIPGSSSDWQTVQSFIALRGPASQIVAGSEQVPLVQLGDFNLGKWQRVTRVEKSHVYSWVMNNYWFTNFRAEQEGEFKWHYYLTSTKDLSRTAATRFGWGSRVPLVTRVLPPVKTGAAREPQALSALRLGPANLLVVEARPTSDGHHVFLHLRELDGQASTLGTGDLATRVSLHGIDEVNILEETSKSNIAALTFKPYEVKWARLKIK
jgi:hypothetical protein